MKDKSTTETKLETRPIVKVKNVRNEFGMDRISLLLRPARWTMATKLVCGNVSMKMIEWPSLLLSPKKYMTSGPTCPWPYSLAA